MRAITSVLLGGALAWSMGGCGDSKSGGASNKEQFVSQICDEYADCCRAAGRPADGAQCRAFYGAFTPSSGYDPAAAQQCLDEVRNLEDKCNATSSSTRSCGKVFGDSGATKQPGETCEDDSDCVPADMGKVECVSDFVDGATIKQCQVRLPGVAGSSPCVGTVDGKFTFSSGTPDGIPPQGYLCDKADGLACDGATGACQQLAQVGEACGAGCVPSAFCDFSSGKCQARAAVGAGCGGDDECQAEAYCDSASQLCAARGKTGDACKASSECASDNCVNQKCAAENDLGLALLCGSP